MKQVTQKVESTLGKLHVRKCLREVSLSPMALHGIETWETMASDMVLITLYRDITNCSYEELRKFFEGERSFKKSSLSHNVCIARLRLASWANGLINLDVPPRELANISVRLRLTLPKGVSSADVWVDSTDFPLIESQGRGRQSDCWSYKLNAPGQRYIIYTDAQKRVIKVDGPCSPKVVFHTIEISDSGL